MGALCNDVERDLHSDVNLVWHHPWKLCFYSQDDQYECLLDTTSNGIYQAVHWVAEHYKSGTPITLLNRPIPKLKNAKSWKVWKKRLLYYYNRPSLYDSSLFLYCATKYFWDGGRFWYFPQFLSHLNGNPEDFHIQILKRQQCTVSRKTNPNASGEIAQNKYKINSRPTRLFFSLKKPDFLWSLTTIWFPQERSFTSLTALSFVCFR